MNDSKETQKYWTLNRIAFLVTGISLLVSVMYIYYVENIKRPDVTWDVLSDEQVFTVNNTVDSLQILFNGENLMNKKEELRLLTINVKNTGSINITESMYSNSIDYGFSIDEGEILPTPEIIHRSNEYIEHDIKFTSSEQFVHLPKTVLDIGDHFTIKCLYFSTNDTMSIKVSGKISGIDLLDVPILKNPIEEANKKFPWALFWISLVILWLLIQKGISIWKGVGRRRRKRRYKRFVDENDLIALPPRVSSTYIEHGKDRVIGYLKLLSSAENIIEAVKNYKNIWRAKMDLMRYDERLARDYQVQFCQGYHAYEIEKMLREDKEHIFESEINDKGVKRYNEDHVKSEVVNSAGKFLEFLKYE